MKAQNLRDSLKRRICNQDVGTFIQKMSFDVSYSSISLNDIQSLLDGKPPKNQDVIDFVCREFDGYLSPGRFLNPEQATMCAFLIYSRFTLMKVGYGNADDLLSGILTAGLIMVESGERELLMQVMQEAFRGLFF
jgi:hypothetical protein